MIHITHRLFLVLVTALVASAHARKRHATRGLFEQYQYVAAHNAVRFTHGASGLTWSDTLADAANAWVQGCSFSHSGGVLSDGTAYGENMAAATKDISIQEAVDSFVSDQGQGQAYNHFSQVVWKGTTEVGCAMTSACRSELDSGLQTLVACFYSPPGNIIGQLEDNVQL